MTNSRGQALPSGRGPWRRFGNLTRFPWEEGFDPSLAPAGHAKGAVWFAVYIAALQPHSMAASRAGYVSKTRSLRQSRCLALAQAAVDRLMRGRRIPKLGGGASGYRALLAFRHDEHALTSGAFTSWWSRLSSARAVSVHTDLGVTARTTSSAERRRALCSTLRGEHADVDEVRVARHRPRELGLR